MKLVDNYPVGNDFPVGLLPKKETEVTSFLAKNTEYDGRGTIIAIFDSGVDPNAPGLQFTTEGKVKVIHRFDCSGAGDVNTKTVVEPKDGIIVGLTGRKLKIPSEWKNPTNTYRIGVKNAYALYTERLRHRISNDYKNHRWDMPQRAAVAGCNRVLGSFESMHTGHQLNDTDIIWKENLDTKLELLLNFDKKYQDNGPVFDCVLWHNGEMWHCCVDTTERGELEKCFVLREYSLTYDFAALTQYDQLNYSMNVHDNGDTLELVGLCSNHGTHVASIAAGYFPNDLESNGIAPGAQIISFTIGDGRLGSMETGTALVRAMIKVMELSKKQKIHVINMSYGEHAHFSDVGRIGELMNEIVNKYGIVWVASAGNAGPALSTIGTPPDISQETIIGVGAYVSPEMMVAAYSMREKLPGMAFTWSSRGPCIDGGMGVTICAPGGAVTSVPNCTLRFSQLMNGTSMASPHVAGAVSLLISGCLKEELSYSPYSIKRAIENTALKLEGVEIFAQGNGLLQVDKCFSYLLNYHDVQETNVRFHVACGPNHTKGIYMRTKELTPTSYNISVEPRFLDSDNVPNLVKINFNIKLALVCSASYVSAPTHLHLSNGARVFAVKVDPTGLIPGVHSTFIDGFDVHCVRKGTLFRIPITIIQPQAIVSPRHGLYFTDQLFHPNTIKRHFIVVPVFATWAVLKMSTYDEKAVGRFIIHAMHILPKQSCKTLEFQKADSVSGNWENTFSFQVRSNFVLEIVIAKYWANLGEMPLNYSISFYGVKPNQQTITMHAADGIHTVEVTSLQGEEILPSITLKNSVQILKPSEAKVLPLTARDIIPPSRQIYELVLVYNFTLSKATEVSPNYSLLNNVLYESEFESQLWLLFSSTKQLLGCGDAYPSKYSLKLEKGEYAIRLHVRHEKKEYLEKLVDVPMLIQQKLTNNITLDVYSSYSQAVVNGKKCTPISGLGSMVVPYYIAPLASDKFLQKTNNVAHILTGTITYARDDHGKKVDSYPVKYILCDNINAKKSANGGSGNTSTATSTTTTTTTATTTTAVTSSTTTTTIGSITNIGNSSATNTEKSKYDEIKDSIRDLKVQLLGKIPLENSVIAKKLYEEFIAEYPDHNPLHVAYMQIIDPLDVKHAYPPLRLTNNFSFTLEVQNEILAICDKILPTISADSILAFMAMKLDLRPDASKIKSNMDQQRNIFLECLCRKGIALCRLFHLEPDLNKKGVLREQITKLWKDFCYFVDPNDAKVTTPYIIYFGMWHAKVYEHLGRLLKFTIKLQEDKPQRELEEKIIDLCDLNEWSHVTRHFRRNLPSKFPAAYAPF